MIPPRKNQLAPFDTEFAALAGERRKQFFAFPKLPGEGVEQGLLNFVLGLSRNFVIGNLNHGVESVLGLLLKGSGFAIFFVWFVIVVVVKSICLAKLGARTNARIATRTCTVAKIVASLTQASASNALKRSPIMSPIRAALISVNIFSPANVSRSSPKAAAPVQTPTM